MSALSLPYAYRTDQFCGSLRVYAIVLVGVPKGIRTPVTAVKGRLTVCRKVHHAIPYPPTGGQWRIPPPWSVSDPRAGSGNERSRDLGRCLPQYGGVLGKRGVSHRAAERRHAEDGNNLVCCLNRNGHRRAVTTALRQPQA